ncbi:porin [Xenophilus sp. AP218F]|nr:porin [Xenophilus sp. AP218F]
MKKTILAAALCVAIPSFALADVTVYGSVRAGISSIKTKETNFKQSFGVDDFGSRIGFKGSENLGNGLKAIWQVETGFGIDGTTGNSSTDTGTFANRESFVGLQGSFGKVRVGHVTDLLSDTQATDNLTSPRRDFSGAMFPLYEKHSYYNDFGDGRFKNSVRYDSPEFAGFSGSIQYGAGEKQDAGQMKQGNHAAAKLAYKNSGFFGAYAHAEKFNTFGSENHKVDRIEGGYSANDLYLAATYQRAKAAKSAGEVKVDAWALAAGYTIGQWVPFVQYSQRGDYSLNGQNVADSGTKQWAIAVDYKLSKQTTLRAGYGEAKQESQAQKIHGWTEDKATSTWAMVKHNF